MAKAARPSSTSSPGSLLPADRARRESIRLLLQAEVYDPLTYRFLVDAGLQSGMRVLDIGSGLGSVSHLVSEIVGPEGSVVRVERSAELVTLAEHLTRRAGITNVRYVVGDAESLALSSPFDAMVGRFVLRELNNLTEAFRSLLRLLAPGAIVAFQEKVISVPVTSSPRLASVEKVRSWMDQARARAGVEVSMGAKLPQVFVSAGLPPPELRFEAPIGYAVDWVGYDYLVEMVRGMLPLIQLYGIASEQEIGLDMLADEMRSEAEASRGVVILTPCIGAWAVFSADCQETGYLHDHS